MYNKEFNFYNMDEIKEIVLNDEKLVYADNGIDEFVVKYKDLPHFIVDMSRSMGNHCELKIYNYPATSMTPILTTIGEFLNKCNPDVRKDINDTLVQVQQTGDIKNYSLIDENDLDKVFEDIRKSTYVKINNIWKYDKEEIRCNASIYIDGKEYCNIIERYPSILEISKKETIVTISEDIKNGIGYYLHLPKISKVSPLLQEIYQNVCESEASMCHITPEDWKENYADKYNEKDIVLLKSEIEKYQLQDTITIDDGEYKIIGWGNLEVMFNDDRDLKLELNKKHEKVASRGGER